MSARATTFLNDLRAAVSGEVREAEPLSRYSTYRIGGPATMLFPKAVEDIERAVSLATARGVAWFALGLGSNVLLPDEGLDALVIRLGKGLDAIKSDGDRWTIGAGLPAPIAARRTAESGWSGLHKMVGVPGSVGGGVFMNAGCHGAEWADVIETVTVVDWDGTVRERSRDEIPFAYRRSGLAGTIVIETRVRLQSETPTRLTEEVNDLFRWRQEGTPFNRPCCGSVFTNPAAPVAPDLRTAGQLVDAAGLKGFSIGGAQVSPMHANYIVNTGGATARQVREVIGHVRRTVHDRFGVELELEVKLVGSDGSVTTEP
ncbi:MAG TPA: UDP-N-acetylmuramate dehydrogenase [Gemmatimonadales bacterium]